MLGGIHSHPELHADYGPHVGHPWLRENTNYSAQVCSIQVHLPISWAFTLVPVEGLSLTNDLEDSRTWTAASWAMDWSLWCSPDSTLFSKAHRNKPWFHHTWIKQAPHKENSNPAAVVDIEKENWISTPEDLKFLFWKKTAGPMQIDNAPLPYLCVSKFIGYLIFS